jgi:hypothetical protein
MMPGLLTEFASDSDALDSESECRRAGPVSRGSRNLKQAAAITVSDSVGESQVGPPPVLPGREQARRRAAVLFEGQ